jgi:beta-galactosidase|nr:glycoside hydrolase family 2 protein [Bacteroidales bacterium]
MQAVCETSNFSKAGFFQVENTGRHVFDFNVGWRFYKGAMQGAEEVQFNDSLWSLVNCPHGLEYVSENASGSNNYQGEAWYRKHFTLDKSFDAKVNKLVFEGVMGKCKVWGNGQLCAEHFGAYLPFMVNLADHVRWDEDNVISRYNIF